MTSYVHFPVIAMCFFLLMSMRRYWICMRQLRAVKEVARRAPSLVHGDIVAAVFAMLPFLLAAWDWTGFTLPRHPAPISSWIAVSLSVACAAIACFTLWNTGERFQGTWAGSRESAIRTLAALDIIDAAELHRSLQYLEDRKAGATHHQHGTVDGKENGGRK